MEQDSGSGVSRGIGWFLGLIAIALIVVGLGSMWANHNTDNNRTNAQADNSEATGPVDPIRFDSALGQNATSAEQPQNIDDVIEIVETSWALTQTGRTDTLVLFRNTGSVTWTDVTVKIEVLGPLGQVVDTKRSSVQILVPDRTFAASRVTNTPRDDVSDLRVTVTAAGSNDTSSSSDGYWITVDPWRVNANGQPLVEGTVQAAYDPPVSRLIALAVLRDADGRFAGSAYDSIDMPTAETTGYSITIWDTDALSTAEVYIAS